MSLRVAHLCGGIFFVGGFASAVLAVVAAAHDIHGYLDVFEFLLTLGLGCVFVVWGWVLAGANDRAPGA